MFSTLWQVPLYPQLPAAAANSDSLRVGFWQIYRSQIENSLLQEQVVELDEERVLRQYNYAIDSFNKLRYPESLQAFARLALEFPNTIWAKKSLFKMGEISEKIGQDENAIKHYRSVLEIYVDPALDDLALYRIGNIYRRQPSRAAKGNAIKVFFELVNKYPRSVYTARSYFNIAQVYWKQNRWSEAERYFRLITKMYPDALWDNGVSLAHEAEIYQDASGYLSRSKDDEKGYLNLQRQSEAIKNYSLTLKLSPDESLRGLTYLRMGQAYEKLGREREAIDHYIMASENKTTIFADYADFRISEIYYMVNIKEDTPATRSAALESYQDLISHYPRSRFVGIALNRIEVLQNDYLRSGRAENNNLLSRDLKGLASYHLYRQQRALVEYNSILRNYPGHRIIHQAYPYIVEALSYIGLWQGAEGIYLSKVQGIGNGNLYSNRIPDSRFNPLGGSGGTYPAAASPGSALSMMSLADLQANLAYPGRDIEKAKKVYLEIAHLFAKSPIASQALFKAGKLYEEKESWESALSTYWEAAAQGHYSPWAEEALYGIGVLYQTGRVGSPQNNGSISQDSVTIIASATVSGTTSNTFEEVERFSFQLSDDERYELALSAFTNLIETYPESFLAARASFQSGKVLATLGRFDEARGRLNQAISMSSRDRGEDELNLFIDAKVELDLLKGK